jgi:hypothetical protein
MHNGYEVLKSAGKFFITFQTAYTFGAIQGTENVMVNLRSNINSSNLSYEAKSVALKMLNSIDNLSFTNFLNKLNSVTGLVDFIKSWHLTYTI